MEQSIKNIKQYRIVTQKGKPGRRSDRPKRDGQRGKLSSVARLTGSLAGHEGQYSTHPPFSFLFVFSLGAVVSSSDLDRDVRSLTSLIQHFFCGSRRRPPSKMPWRMTLVKLSWRLKGKGKKSYLAYRKQITAVDSEDNLNYAKERVKKEYILNTPKEMLNTDGNRT